MFDIKEFPFVSKGIILQFDNVVARTCHRFTIFAFCCNKSAFFVSVFLMHEIKKSITINKL